MIELTIDGRPAQVDPGETVLAAARRLGIDIPTLCHSDGLPPSTSCFVCVVKVRGASRLLPACTLPAEQGMEVTTDSSEVREARRSALELLLSDHVGDCVAPCALACPAGLDVPEFLRRLRAGDEAWALVRARQDLALPGCLGRVCHAPCEKVCRRGSGGEAVAIRDLHRCLADRTRDPSPPVLRPRPTGRRAAVVGAGPAGLAAAYHLAAAGHACTVFEARGEAGGLFRYGIPAFRLPRDVLAAEVDAIRQMGVEIVFGARLGRDVMLDSLLRRFGAVFVAIGAPERALLGLPGEESALDALDFLESCARREAQAGLGETIVVGDLEVGLDAARSALRLGRAVRLLTEHARDACAAALRERAAEAEAEGVSVAWECRATRIEKCEDGFRVSISGGAGESVLSARAVVVARDRRPDTLLASGEGLAVRDQRIVADRHTLATNLPGVFAGGEAAAGHMDGVRAVAAGRAAAAAMDQYLGGRPVVGRPRPFSVSMGRLDEREATTLFGLGDPSPRCRPVSRPPAERAMDFHDVRLTLDQAAARSEAGRCLDCDCGKKDGCRLRSLSVALSARPRKFTGERRRFERDDSHPRVVYEPGKCIACGACRRVAEQMKEKYGLAFLGRGFGMKMGVPLGRRLGDVLGAAARPCAEVCPTGALCARHEPGILLERKKE